MQFTYNFMYFSNTNFIFDTTEHSVYSRKQKLKLQLLHAQPSNSLMVINIRLDKM